MTLEQIRSSLQSLEAHIVHDVEVDWNKFRITFTDGSYVELEVVGTAGTALEIEASINSKIEGELR